MRRRTKQQLATGAVIFLLAGAGALARPYLHPGTIDDAAARSAVTISTPAGRPSAPSTTANTKAAATALRDLRTLPLSDAYVAGYDRSAFGPAWADTDHNGCDTRNDILRRDLVDVITKPGTHECVVLSGILRDPYTGRTIHFHRGPTSSMAVQIDHRWPLGLAWEHGAASWTAAQREQFANDPAELIAVDGPANEAKSDSGPAGWMPPNPGDACTYASTFVAVATTWHLSIATTDKQALDRTLTRCEASGVGR